MCIVCFYLCFLIESLAIGIWKVFKRMLKKLSVMFAFGDWARVWSGIKT